MFYLMEMVDGCTFWDGTLPNIRKDERRAYYESLTDTLAALHSIDYIQLGLGDFGVSGNYVARQVHRWTKQYRAAQTEVIAEVEELIKWLPHTVPEQTGASIIHGDYRIDNVIFDVAGPRVHAVLDWELATIGDPLADFAYFAMSWTLVQGGRSGLGGVNLAEAGLPTLGDVVARYCAATGREALPALHWYFAYNLFRLVGIIQGIKKRVADGNASSAAPAETLALLQPYAQTAWNHARLAGA